MDQNSNQMLQENQVLNFSAQKQTEQNSPKQQLLNSLQQSKESHNMSLPMSMNESDQMFQQ